jgi:hypothetical protein
MNSVTTVMEIVFQVIVVKDPRSRIVYARTQTPSLRMSAWTVEIAAQPGLVRLADRW